MGGMVVARRTTNLLQKVSNCARLDWLCRGLCACFLRTCSTQQENRVYESTISSLSEDSLHAAQLRFHVASAPLTVDHAVTLSRVMVTSKSVHTCAVVAD